MRIQVTQSGRKVRVCGAFIESYEPSQDGGTLLNMVSGSTVVAKETIEDIGVMLETPKMEDVKIVSERTGLGLMASMRLISNSNKQIRSHLGI